MCSGLGALRHAASQLGNPPMPKSSHETSVQTESLINRMADALQFVPDDLLELGQDAVGGLPKGEGPAPDVVGVIALPSLIDRAAAGRGG